MNTTANANLHAVFVVIDGEKWRVSDWTNWNAAINRHTAMDNQRHETLTKKGQVVYRFGGGDRRVIRGFEVRSQTDPGYNSRPFLRLVPGIEFLTREYTTDTAAAKAVLTPLGYYAKSGGWVYEDKDHKVINQGWVSTATLVGHRVVRLPYEQGYRAVATKALCILSEQGQVSA